MRLLGEVSLLAEVSHDEAFLPRRERPLLAGKGEVKRLIKIRGFSQNSTCVVDEAVSSLTAIDLWASL